MDGFIASGGYVLHQYSQSNFLHHIRGAWCDVGGASAVLRASTGKFLEARWYPSFEQVDSEPPLSSSTLGHLQSMNLEDYKKLNTIAAHLRAHNPTEITRGLFLQCSWVVSWRVFSRLNVSRAIAFDHYLPSHRGAFRYTGLGTLLRKWT